MVAAFATVEGGGGQKKAGKKMAPPRSTLPKAVQSPAAPTGGGGGGGGGGSVAAAAPAPMDFSQYLPQNFLYQQQKSEGSRLLDDYDATTLFQKQQTEADQGLRRAGLRTALNDMTLGNAGDFASRGLLRSGLFLQGNDKIAAEGVNQETSIQKLMSDLIASRTSGKNSLIAQNNSSLNDVIAKVMDQFNQTQRIS